MGQMAGGNNGDFGGETGDGGGNIVGNLLKGGLKGLGAGLQNYAGQQSAIQNRPGFMPQNSNTTPSISADYFSPKNYQQNNQDPFKMRGNNLNFYGGE